MADSYLSVLILLGLAALLATEAGAQEKPSAAGTIKISGGIQAYAGYYTPKGIEGRNQPAPLGLNASVNLSLPGGINLPFSAVLGNQGSSFRQPFNQFGASPGYKWATVHAGYRNVSFSPFTLAGHTFLGGGVELNPGKLRIGAVYGRFNKATSTTVADPAISPSFRRTGYALKLGYGTARNYVDLVMLRARDDTSKISLWPADSIGNTRPAENLVVGITSRLLLVKHISVEADIAGSAYTRDMRSTEVQGEASNRLIGLAGNFITPRLSTQLTRAAHLAVGYQDKWGSVRMQYKRIDPNFQTMGAYYFQSDIESYTLISSLNLVRGKIRVSGSYGRQFDNLARNKSVATGRSVGSLMLSLNPDPTMGLDLSLSNYGISQKAGIRPLIDTLRIAQNNLSASANMRYMLSDTDLTHLFTLSASHQQLSDLNKATAGQTETNNQNFNLGYFLQQNKTGFGLNLMASYTQTSLAVLPLPDSTDHGKLRFYGPTVGANYALLKKKINTSANFSYLFNRQYGVTGKVLTGTFQAGYQVTKKQTLSFSLNYLDSYTGVQAEKFNELRVNAGYGISF